jgi:hypothetical protein
VENLKIRIVAIKREKEMVREGGRRGSVTGRESEGERVVDRI